MKIKEEIAIRFIFLVIGSVFGLVLSFSLIFLWLVIKGYILGYGDSGPEWVGIVSDSIEIVVFIVCLVLSQIMFTRYKKKQEKNRDGRLNGQNR